MSNGGRTNWKQRAEQAEEKAKDLEVSATHWRAVASQWRQKFQDLDDAIVFAEAEALANLEAEPLSGDEPADDVVPES
jgi:hypothetical protein